jgi:hypothetical protein
LNPADWNYFTGGDGTNPGSWSARIQEAEPLLKLRTHCGQSGPCYIPSLRLYLMVVWYNTAKMIKWFEPNEMRYDFYQAPHPWGPWTAVGGYSDRFLAPGEHMYGPSLCAKFQRMEGTDVHVALFTSGCPFEDAPGGLYKAWSIPLIVKTAPVIPSVRIAGADARVAYQGLWSGSGPARQSSSAGDSAELAFQGVGVDCIADKQAGFGSVEIHLDGVRAHTASLAVQNLPRLSGVTVFRSGRLAKGAHTIRIVNQTAAPVVLAAFDVYG